MDATFEYSHRRFVPYFVIALGILVFVVVAVGIAQPLKGPRNVALRAAALHDEKLIIDAVKAYQKTYGKLPVDPDASGVLVFSRDNNVLLDVLRNRTGQNYGNALNPRNFDILQVPPSENQKNPRGGLQISTGVWYDPWGTPYHIAINIGHAAPITAKDIPNFYSDAGPLKDEVIVWSYGENGKLGGGAATNVGFSDEPGAPAKLFGSGDVVSWK
ncbi:MAG TPA: hypothetical protein VG733_00765 [Chthoniobacteraceae bacterium]|nr:hypothetical protein [Chthoniobacteraceae bacterium]